MRQLLLGTVTLGCLLGLGESGVTSQDRYISQAHAFRAQVIPYDSDGHFVSGLTAPDFRIRVDGEAARVLDVEEVREATDARTAPARVVIALDLYTGARREDEWDAAKVRLRDFVRDLDGSHHVAIVASRVRGPVELHNDYSDDTEQLLSALDRAFSSASEMRTSSAARRSAEKRGPNGGALSLGAVARFLDDDRYRLPLHVAAASSSRDVGAEASDQYRTTHLLFFSMGDREISLENPRFRALLDDTLGLLRDAGVVVHAFQPFGMPIERDDRAPLQYIALETAGTLWMYEQNVNRGLASVRKRLDEYYVLTFVPKTIARLSVDLAIEFESPEVVNWSGPRVLRISEAGGLPDW